jgi:hypothetical protein
MKLGISISIFFLSVQTFWHRMQPSFSFFLQESCTFGKTCFKTQNPGAFSTSPHIEVDAE